MEHTRQPRSRSLGRSLSCFSATVVVALTLSATLTLCSCLVPRSLQIPNLIPIPLALQIYCLCSDKEPRQVRSICGVTTKMKKTSQKVRVGAKAFFAMLKSIQMQRFSIHGSWNTYAHYCTMLRRTNVSTSN